MANLAKSVPVVPHFEIGSQGLRIIQGRTLVGDLRRLRMRQLGLVARNKGRTRVPWGIQLRGLLLLLPLLLRCNHCVYRVPIKHRRPSRQPPADAEQLGRATWTVLHNRGILP